MSKDLKRTERILRLMGKIQKDYPHLNLTRLISNPFMLGDLWHVEDDELEDGLKLFYRKKSGG